MSAFTKSQSQFVPKAPKAEVQIALTPIEAGLKRLSHRCISLLLVEERPRRRKRGASCRATRTRSRRGRSSEYAVNLGGHDEVVLMQSLNLLGLQRDRRIAPTEADIRMVAFGFREFTNLLNKGKRVAEIAKPEAPLDAVSFDGTLTAGRPKGGGRPPCAVEVARPETTR